MSLEQPPPRLRPRPIHPQHRMSAYLTQALCSKLKYCGHYWTSRPMDHRMALLIDTH
jgi:hypothetical protein